MAKENVVQLIIEGNNISAIKAVDGTITKLDQLSNKTNSISSGFNALRNSLGGIFVGLSFGAIITGLSSVIKSAIDTADELYKMSQKVGINVESLSTLKYAAQLSDISLEALTTSLSRFSRNINEAKSGTGQAKNVFKELGITIRDNNNQLLPINEILLQIADKFRYMPDSVEKTAYAIELFGRSGTDLITLLNQGSIGIAELQDEARKLGFEISTNTAQQAEQFNDSLKRLQNSFNGIIYQTLPPLIDFLSQAAEGFIAANNAAKNANNIFEFWSNLETNAIIEGIKNGQKFRQDSFRDAINIAIQQAREKMIGLTDNEVKLLAEQVKIKIDALKKLETTEEIKNDIAQLEAQLKIYQERFILTDKQKKKLEELKQTESQLTFEASLLGLNEFDRKLLEINREADELTKKFGPQKFIDNWQKANIASLISDSFKDGLEYAAKLDEEMNDKIMKNAEESTLASIEDNRIKLESEYELAEEKKKLLLEQQESESYQRSLFIDGLGMMSESMLMFAELGGRTNKDLFAMHKAFAIAQAVMNTYVGATKALDQAGVFGPFVAAAVIAFGLAQVAKIAATQPGSSGVGGTGGSSISIPTSGLQSVINNTNINNSNQRAVNITVNVNSEVLTGNDLDKWVRDNLSISINKAINDGKIDFS